MARLNVSPTKSNLLSLKRQLAFAEEGYDLLEQKRQILVLELMKRLARAREVERRVASELAAAGAALREAQLDVGSVALDAAAVGQRLDHEVELRLEQMMGMTLVRVAPHLKEPRLPGLGGTSSRTDEAMGRYRALLPELCELAELQVAVGRLACELRKTQRRCNALSKLFMPGFRETIGYVAGTLEEREREAYVITKMIRNRLARTA